MRPLRNQYHPVENRRAASLATPTAALPIGQICRLPNAHQVIATLAFCKLIDLRENFLMILVSPRKYNKNYLVRM